jgi:hypothetical protein
LALPRETTSLGQGAPTGGHLAAAFRNLMLTIKIIDY